MDIIFDKKIGRNRLVKPEEKQSFIDIKLSQSEIDKTNEVLSGDDIPELDKDAWDNARGHQTEVINKKLVENCLSRYINEGSYTIVKLAADLGLSEECIAKFKFHQKTW